jgi:hypothetical protein
MDMNNIQITISLDISFGEIPKGAEEYASGIESDATSLFEAHIDINDLSDLDTNALQQKAEAAVQSACSLCASSAQREEQREWASLLSENAIVTVMVSDTPENILSQIEELVSNMVSQELQSVVGGG